MYVFMLLNIVIEGDNSVDIFVMLNYFLFLIKLCNIEWNYASDLVK